MNTFCISVLGLPIAGGLTVFFIGISNAIAQSRKQVRFLQLKHKQNELK